MDRKYLELLAAEYPTMESAASEIINLKAIQCLPKGTEYFFSDLHGECDAFLHLLKSASGIIRLKIDALFENSVSEEARSELATLIYYPEEELEVLRPQKADYADWCKVSIYRLVQVCKEVSGKYTRSKVRKKIPPAFAYIIDELLHGDYTDVNKKHYYNAIIKTIVEENMGEPFICEMCFLIQKLCVDSLHIIGDIYDRGPRADIIMNELMNFHEVDIQWGNHDISWMGAAAGNQVCMANVLRIGISYNNFDFLEDGYGINLRALSIFALETYKDDPCTAFAPHILDENKYDPVDALLAAKMHKAIAMIQFKLEGQLIERHPEYQMEDRNLLPRVNLKEKTIELDGKIYPIRGEELPTVSEENPLELTQGERELMYTLASSFLHSEPLHRHVQFLYSNGSMWQKVNNNLLYHGCLPMKADGTFDELELDGKKYAGRELMDYLDKQVRNAYFLPEGHADKEKARDLMWYLWCGSKSPLFGKNRMTTFERYFVAEKETHKEFYNPYYKLTLQEDICNHIMESFDMDPHNAHIINGHVPVKSINGEEPIKANGKLFVIDGGISKAYQTKTGIAGYTLIFNSRQLSLAEHSPLQNDDAGLMRDNTPKIRVVEVLDERITVSDTDTGKKLAEKIASLEQLLQVYRDGSMKQHKKL